MSADRIAELEAEIERLRQQNAELLKLTQWQPIETAPKDGSYFPVAHADGEMEFVEWDNDNMGFWYSPYYDDATDPVYWFNIPDPPKANGGE